MDNFIEQVKSLSNRVNKLKDNIETEEATKTSVVMPFFQVLGYDIFNPEEFLPEFTADVGIKKGEKVDYAIVQNGQPIILIEAKAINQKLEKHDSQLFRYFSTTSAKFSILTNGINYKFYTDLEEKNRMDTKPFFEFNLMDPREHQIIELSKFMKSKFDVENILTTASELKYTGEIKQFFVNQWENPTDDFVALILGEIYSGKRTRNVIEKFRGLVKKSQRLFINDIVNDKLKAALSESDDEKDKLEKEVGKEVSENNLEKNESPQIITTEEEIEGYVIVKFILKGIIQQERIFYRDNLSYFNVLLDDNIRKWICRLGLDRKNKYIQFNDDERSVHTIEQVSDIEKFKDHLINIVKKLDSK